MVSIDSSNSVSLIEVALLTGLGLLLIIYAVAQRIDIFSHTLPAISYAILGTILLLWGVSLNWRSSTR